MKNKYILLLLVIAGALIAVGVFGLTRSKKAESPSASDGDASTHITGVSSQSPRLGLAADPLLNVVIPAGIPSQIKDYEGFRVSFNSSTHTPNWVAWELLGSETQGDIGRSNNFWTDNDVEGCPTLADYKNSGYDRGHLCPAADQKWSQKAMDDCFVFTNMCPQAKALNTGAWNTLEAKERQWAQRDSAILIVAGPIYSKDDKERIGPTGVRVPGAFFKVMAAPYLDSPRGIAFVYPNMASPGNMENYSMTIDEVEQLTGYDFFSALPDNIENLIESKSSFKEWNRR